MGLNSLNLIHSFKKKTTLSVDLYCARCSIAGAEDTEERVPQVGVVGDVTVAI